MLVRIFFGIYFVPKNAQILKEGQPLLTCKDSRDGNVVFPVKELPPNSV